jgi:hypothetical protein
MMTIRSHDQFNTTIYSNDDRYRGIHGERRVVLLNEADVRRSGIRGRCCRGPGELLRRGRTCRGRIPRRVLSHPPTLCGNLFP